MKESGEVVPIDTNESVKTLDTVIAPVIKIENKAERKLKIDSLQKEIEQIKIADSKVVDANLRNIPLTAVADNISMAGKSIQERQEQIKKLKQQISSSKTKWWQQAAMFLGF